MRSVTNECFYGWKQTLIFHPAIWQEKMVTGLLNHFYADICGGKRNLSIDKQRGLAMYGFG